MSLKPNIFFYIHQKMPFLAYFFVTENYKSFAKHNITTRSTAHSDP